MVKTQNTGNHYQTMEELRNYPKESLEAERNV